MEDSDLKLFQDTVHISDGHIFIKPVCDFFNIDGNWQVEVIKKHHILSASYEKNKDKSLFGDNIARAALGKEAFITWILLINVNLVREDLQEQFKKYQSLIFTYLLGSLKDREYLKNSNQRLDKLIRLRDLMNKEITAERKNIKGLLENSFQIKLALK
jgi:hypothetical protein